MPELTRRAIDALRALRALARLIAGNHDRDTLLQRAAETIVESLGVVAGQIEVRDAAGASQRFGAGDPLVLERQRGCFVDPARTRCEHGGIAVPIAHAGETFGRLIVLPTSDRTDDARERELLAGIGEELGFALRAYALEASVAAREAREHAHERRRAEQLARIAESVPGLLYAFARGPDGAVRMRFASHGAEETLGVSREELLADATAWRRNLHPDDAERVLAGVLRSVREGTPWHDEWRLRHPRKGLRWIVGTASAAQDAVGTIEWHGFMSDVTDRRHAYERVERLSRHYRALSEASDAVARAVDEPSLLRRLCESLAPVGGLRVVSVSLASADGWSLECRAHAGPALEGCAEPLSVSLDPFVPDAATLAAEVFRAGAPRVVDDYRVSAARAPCLPKAEEAGIRSAAAVPLRRGGVCVGVLGAGAAEPAHFDDELLRLLDSMAGNLEVGLDRIDRARALRESEARFRQIFELAPVGVLWLDAKNGRYLRVNQRCCEILGYSAEELATLSWTQLTHPDDVEVDVVNVAQLVAGRISEFRREKRYVRKDGSVLWGAVHVRRVGSRIPAQFHLAILQDVTPRKEAELALRASEERYRTLVERLDDVVFLSDREGRITFVSAAVARFGWTPAQVVGRSNVSLVHPDDCERLLRERQTVLRTAGAGVFEYRLLDADGRVRFVRVRAQPLRNGEETTGLTTVMSDLTELREAEERLRSAQRMEAIGRLAGGLAHDFNNSLSVILSYAELALDAVAPSDPLHDDLDEIRAAASRAAGLTRQLLALSGSEAVHVERFDLDARAARLARTLRKMLGEEIEVSYAPPPRAAIVEADPGQLEQALTNLALNARDAMPEGGRLAMSVDLVDAAGAPVEPARDGLDGTFVRLRVADTGHGMDEPTRARIFEPFFTTKQLGKGTGLGLAMVNRLIQRSGGTIDVTSRFGEGTTFELRFPSASGPLPDESRPRRARAQRGVEVVLLVEDEAAVRALARRALEAAGYRVLVAANAGEALLACEQHAGEIHLMVTDVVMPGMNGKQLADRLAPLRPAMKVLFISGYADDVLTDRGVRGDALLDKPFTGSTLSAKVRSVLDG
jgi:PAS domain S-box-containing protein